MEGGNKLGFWKTKYNLIQQLLVFFLDTKKVGNL